MDAAVSFPPLDKYFTIGIWIENLIYGCNAIMYFSALAILTRNRGMKPPYFLLGMITIHFLLATAYTSVCLQQMLEAFVYLTPGPGVATQYFAYEPNPLAVSKLVMFELMVFVQDLILIWRLWVIWGNNWKIVILPLALECFHTACGFISTARGAQPNVLPFDEIIHRWATIYWSLDIVVNLGVTGAIVYRLWQAGRSVSMITGRKHKYLGPILTLVESGAIYASMVVVLFGVYLSGNAAIAAFMDISAQLAVFTPLLIVVRIGLGLHHTGSVNNYTSTAVTYQQSNSRLATTSAGRINVDMTKTVATFEDHDYPLQQKLRNGSDRVPPV